MNILITGGDGYIATELFNRFKRDKEHQVIKAPRFMLDCTDTMSVDNFLKENNFDIIIHAAAKGGRRNYKDDVHSYMDNIKMFENFVRNKDLFGLMISLGSGAEFDRTQNITNVSEDNFGLSVSRPLDHYGSSKYYIAARIRKLDTNIVNLRIFNVFGEFEEPTRMVRSAIMQYLLKKPIFIHQNRKMDFFYIGDLYKVVLKYIELYNDKKPLEKDMNISYNDYMTLEEVALEVNELDSHKVEIIIEQEDWAPDYYANGTKLESLGISFERFRNGLRKVYLQDKEKKYDDIFFGGGRY